MGRVVELTCLFILTLTYSSASASQDSNAPPTGHCDYGMITKVVEKLEKRVEALEVENEQQRSEISELKALLQLQHNNHQETPDEASEDRAPKQDVKTDRHKKHTVRRASPDVTIAFYAALKHVIHHLGQGQNVEFDGVVTNIGSAYDPHVGVFRAPVAGVYVFSTTLMTYDRDTTHYGFALNGKRITYMFTNGAENEFDTTSQTIILQLQVGDDVSVQHLDSDKSIHGSTFSVFSGFLLSQTEAGVAVVG